MWRKVAFMVSSMLFSQRLLEVILLCGIKLHLLTYVSTNTEAMQVVFALEKKVFVVFPWRWSSAIVKILTRNSVGICISRGLGPGGPWGAGPSLEFENLIKSHFSYLLPPPGKNNSLVPVYFSTKYLCGYHIPKSKIKIVQKAMDKSGQ